MEGRRERKVVTVLFADLVGFTSRAETMDPEEVAALLDPYHTHVRSELERHGGTVEKFIGDAVMAVFGAPVSHEDDPERAVRAALAIRDWAEGEGIELRIGVNTGEALVSLDAAALPGAQGMAAGDVVNTAARLQTAAPVGGILAGAATVRATERTIGYGEEIAVEAKGKAQPVSARPVLEATARAHVERVHGATLVGRERELLLLTGALDRARQERAPQLVTLVGIPGIGKSRLVLELYGALEAEPEITLWRHGRCLAYGEGITFWALGEMVKAQAGIFEDDDETEVERKLAAAADDPWIASHLRPLVGLSASEAGAGRRDEAFTAWRRFFEGLADERPLVLVFEDLHWADESLLDFVDHLVDWAAAVPLLVVCTARPELLVRRPGWGGGKQNSLTISLAPLSDGDTARLVGELLATSVLPAETQSELLARAGGNPLYAEEFARMLREQGALERLPETVQGLIAARLDLLDRFEKSLVQDAAVVGKSFWTGALTSLGEADGASLEEALHVLERREFIRRERASAVAGEDEYAFRHVLVRDVAYGQIPRAGRVGKHVATARWIESLGRLEDHAEMLAYHYLQALELGAAAGADVSAFGAQAQSALSDAGDRAAALHAHAAAGRYYGAALELVPEHDPRRNRLLLKLGRSRWLIGEPSFDLLQEAAAGFGAAGDAESLGDAETRLAEAYWLAGERDVAFDHLERALQALEPLPPSPVKAFAISTASRFKMLASEHEAAIEIGREALAMAEALGLEEVRAATLNNIGTSRTSLGDKGGLEEQAEAIRVATEITAPFELARAKGNLASQLWTNGEIAAATQLWQESGEDSRRFGQREFERWVVGVLIVPHYVVGLWDESSRLAGRLIDEVEAGRPHYLAFEAYSCRALIRVARDSAEGARADVEAARDAAARAGDPQAVVPVLARTAQVLLELGDLTGAAAAANDALAQMAEHGGFVRSSVLEVAWALTGLGDTERLLALLADDEVLWVQAARALARGEPLAAAEIAARMGAPTHEAYARLRAGRLLLEEGNTAGAEAELERALAFFRSVGATRYAGEADALFAASA